MNGLNIVNAAWHLQHPFIEQMEAQYYTLEEATTLRKKKQNGM